MDYVVFELLNIHLNLDPTCLDQYNNLRLYHQRMLDRPNIQKYIKSGT